ncbi:MAG: hypothetical protein HYU64_03280 [Armatimonadetes bacterium]|nr:hypothetical protein [Armatimonadota bacterium]
MKRHTRNVAASVRDRLLTRSREGGENFDSLLKRYAWNTYQRTGDLERTHHVAITNRS